MSRSSWWESLEEPLTSCQEQHAGLSALAGFFLYPYLFHLRPADGRCCPHSHGLPLSSCTSLLPRCPSIQSSWQSELTITCTRYLLDKFIHFDNGSTFSHFLAQFVDEEIRYGRLAPKSNYKIYMCPNLYTQRKLNCTTRPLAQLCSQQFYL